MPVYEHSPVSDKRPLPMIHELKSWIEYFTAVRSGAKRLEIRKADRDFQVNDMMLLREWDKEKQTYTGLWSLHVITYLVKGVFEIPDVAVFGFSEPLRAEYDEACSPLGPYCDRIGDKG